MLTPTEREAINDEVEQGTFDLENALDDIATEQKGEGVRRAIYGGIMLANKNGAGGPDLSARNRIADANGRIDAIESEMAQFIASHTGVVEGTRIVEDVLWTGNLYNSNAEGGLYADIQGDDIRTYDYLDIYIKAANRELIYRVTPDALLNSGVQLSTTNLTDNTWTTELPLYAFEYLLNGTMYDDTWYSVEVTITVWKWSGKAAGASDQYANTSAAQAVTKIVGIKHQTVDASKDSELTDMRVGEDGTAYASAGQALRAQIAQLKQMTEVEIDDTLSTAGDAADAKETGDRISQLKSDLNAIGIGELPLNIVRGQYVKTDGGFANDSAWSRSEYIYVGNATDIEIVSTVHSAYNVYYDSAFQKINNFVVESGVNVITLPDGTEYIALSNTTVAMDATTVKVTAYKIDATIADIQSDIVDIQDEISGNLRFDLVANSYVETSGNFASYNGWSRTDYLDVGDYEKLITTNNAVGSPYNVFYDENKTKINNFSIPVGTNEITLPANTKYIAMSNTTAAMEALTVKVSTAYESAMKKVPRNLMIGESVADKVKGYLISEMSNTYIENGAVIPVARYVGLSKCHILPFSVEIDFTDISFKVSHYNSDDITNSDGDTSWGTDKKRIDANVYFTIHAQKSTDFSIDEAFSKMRVTVLDAVSALNDYSAPKLNYATQYSNPSRMQLLWFSDIHADTNRLKRIMQYANAHSDEISDVICTGDMVADKVTDDYTFWSAAGADDVLTIIGNHDGNTGSGWASNQTMYDKFFAPYIADWGVTYTENYCNWYKVYNNSIMLIGLCAVNSTTAETNEMLSFLNTALNLAKTNDYAVVIAHHYPCNPTSTTKYDSAFDTLGFVPTDLFIPESVISAVETFKGNGGEFVCYITGHTHADLARYRTTEKQIVLTISTAFITAGMQQYAQYREYNSKYEDLFNMFYVDRNTKTVAIKRIGSDRDVWFRKLDCLAINYETAELV